MSDDLEDDNLDVEENSFDDFEKKGGKQTLGDVLRTNSMAKIGVVAAAAIGIFGVIMLFGGDETPIAPSAVPTGSEVVSAPGTQEVSPIYREAIEEKNQQRVEEAVNEGGSALPTPIEPPVGRLAVPEQEAVTEDPLQRWRQLQEERMQRELTKAQAVETPEGAVIEDTARTEAVQAMADSMAQQMQAILESQSKETTIQSMNVTDPNFLDKLAESQAQQGASGGDGSGDFFEDEELEDFSVVVVPAGEIVYAQLITEANSDVPGPVLAEIMSGPLAGSRILGEFEVQEELLTLNFNKVVVDGVTQSVDAVALDPATTLPGMATEVDHRYLRRVVLPMAAAFVEGAANAISESGSTTVTIEGGAAVEDSEEPTEEQEIASGIEEAGQELRDILDEMAEGTKVLVKIDSGTPIGILFLDSVLEDPEGTQTTSSAADNQAANPGINVSVTPPSLTGSEED
jgi:intracellular multiplication protein IcmE